LNSGEKGRAALWFLYPACLAAVVAALYLFTLYPGVGGETDTAKWQFVGKVLGMPHITGYPLYVLVNHVFSFLPVGTLAWRINFMSAFFAVLAVVLLQRILRGLLNSELLALGGALVLAVSPMFWTFAVAAGVYSLNAFFICLVMYLLFKWADARRGRPAGGREGRGYFYAACFAYALSLGNHVTMITMLPALVIFALATDWRAVLSMKTMLLSLLFVMLLAGLYIFPFIQTAMPSPYLENRVRTFDDLWRLLTATGFRQYLFAGGTTGLVEMQLPFYISQVSAQFTFFSLLLIMAGLLVLGWEHGRKLAFVATFLGANLCMALNYYVSHAQLQYQFIPSYVFLALVIGMVPGAANALAPHMDRGTRRMFSGAALLVLVGLAGLLVEGNIAKIQAKQREMALNEKLANDVIEALPKDGVILANSYNDSMIFMYKMVGERRESEKRWRVLHDTSWRITRVEPDPTHMTDGRTVYDLSAVERLMRGEKVDWSPLSLEEGGPIRHAVYFSSGDKPLLDRAGYTSEAVDLPGNGTGENCYGGRTIRLYRITGQVTPR
jgi:MFS family permease